MPTMWKRDLDADRRSLAAWLRLRLPNAGEIELSPLVEPQTSGFSNETLLFDLAWTENGRPRRESLVARVQPTGFQVFPEYDLELQYRTMSLLADTDIPVPRMFWLEKEDASVLGAPFYVMGRVEGRVPPDNPPYHAGGWVTEITPAERAAIWWGGIESIARVHRLDYRAAGFGFLERPDLGATPLERQLRYYDRYLAWAARGKPQPTAESARTWLWQNMPQDEPTCLQWGDARIGNIIFDGTRPAAVLDWEMVTLGPPEVDLAWTIFLDRHHSEGIEAPRLEGFPGYEETVARYEQLTGHRARNLFYYQVFAGYRFAVIMMRIAQQMVRYGMLDEEGGYAFERNNTVTRLLAKLLELPPPGAASSTFAPP
jgi:aminoglycoside phosphotransferase (APT) family kinase protein